MEPDNVNKQNVDEETLKNEVKKNEQMLYNRIHDLEEAQKDLIRAKKRARLIHYRAENKCERIRNEIYNERDESIKSIPDFWLTAFMNHPFLCKHLTEKDQKIFKYLASIRVVESRYWKGPEDEYRCTMTLKFNPNPYFKETALYKQYDYSEKHALVEGTPIRWKKGMGMAKRKKGEKYLAEESFFTFFKEGNEVDAHTDGIHDEIFKAIREDLFPNPLVYYKNEADKVKGGDGDEDEEYDSQDEHMDWYSGPSEDEKRYYDNEYHNDDEESDSDW